MPHPPKKPAAPPNGPGKCDRCHADVIYCLNANKISQAINAQRVDYGNQAVHQTETGQWRVRQLGGNRTTLEGSEALHYPHAATCTNPAPKPAKRPSASRVRVGVRPVRWQR